MLPNKKKERKKEKKEERRERERTCEFHFIQGLILDFVILNAC
jgi:hypothetical protein